MSSRLAQAKIAKMVESSRESIDSTVDFAEYKRKIK